MNEELTEIAKKLKAGKPVSPITVRDLLWMFHAQRRGYAIVAHIRSTLSELNLETFPDFETVWMDHPIAFIIKGPDIVESRIDVDAGFVKLKDRVEERVVHADGDIGSQELIVNDPIYRIGNFKSAAQKIISVNSDSSTKECVTLMLASDVSQIPVMNNERDVKGIVTWKSISSRFLLGKNSKLARDCMDVHQEVRHDSSIFSAIPIIMLHDYVLVRARDGKISGIVTASDMSFEFRNLTEPFLLLSEIEQTIRNMIASKFDQNYIKDIMKNDMKREVDDASEMNFGEYIRFLENQERWDIFGINIDRNVFCKKLDIIREIRNDIMHFKFRGRDEDLSSLREFAGFIKYLSAVGI